MMRPLALAILTLLTLITAQSDSFPRTNYFFRFIGGTTILDNQRLRGNVSVDSVVSPGAVQPPFSPADHFLRLATNAIVPSANAILSVVPTHPHPPPVPGYYGLSDKEGIKDAYRLIYSYRLDDEGPGFQYKGWELRKAKESGKVLLRYSWDFDGEWRWTAKRERVFDGSMTKEINKRVPYYVRPSARNVKILELWDYRVVDLELEETKGEVNPGAPGGVKESWP
ncbi:hypothetical protein OQA88_13444 [Cercophora sp. LCS_1]